MNPRAWQINVPSARGFGIVHLMFSRAERDGDQINLMVEDDDGNYWIVGIVDVRVFRKCIVSTVAKYSEITKYKRLK